MHLADAVDLIPGMRGERICQSLVIACDAHHHQACLCQMNQHHRTKMSHLFLHQEYPPHLQAQQLALEPLLERQKQVKLHCHRTVNHTLNEL